MFSLAICSCTQRARCRDNWKTSGGGSSLPHTRLVLSCCLAGLQPQFEALTYNPDIIIATPGRLMHHLMEVSTFSLSMVEMMVFDEADRLFEMGFADQIHEIMTRVPSNKYATRLPLRSPPPSVRMMLLTQRKGGCFRDGSALFGMPDDCVAGKRCCSPLRCRKRSFSFPARV